MSFTDDDLKRLKDDMKGDPEDDVYRGKKNILCFDEMNSLLARLEAAEACAESYVEGWPNGGLATAWRKAAGK